MNTKSFIGVLFYFLINIFIICSFISIGELDMILLFCVIYLVTAFLGISPIGERVIALLSCAKPIPRYDMKLKIAPLVDIVLERACRYYPPMTKQVRILFIEDNSPMAFAIGHHTLCVTEGLLRLTDEQIMGVVAHELGHLAYRHTTVQMFLGSGNIFITGFIGIVKLILKIMTVICGVIAVFGNNIAVKVTNGCIAFVGLIMNGIIAFWTKISMLFLSFGRRENEFIADKFAYEIGYGYQLASALDCLEPPKASTLIQILSSDHPTNNDRIGRLQELGVRYTNY